MLAEWIVNFATLGVLNKLDFATEKRIKLQIYDALVYRCCWESLKSNIYRFFHICHCQKFD